VITVVTTVQHCVRKEAPGATLPLLEKSLSPCLAAQEHLEKITYSLPPPLIEKHLNKANHQIKPYLRINPRKLSIVDRSCIE
jgi:hypothetical protein